MTGTTQHFVADSPACADHFPGAPLMPGALLLDEILRRLPLASAPVSVRHVKFRRPVPPGTAVVLEHVVDDAGACRFVLRADDEVAVEGVAAAAGAS